MTDADFNKQWDEAGKPPLLLWADHMGGLIKTFITCLYFSVYVTLREWYYRTWAIRINKNLWRVDGFFPQATDVDRAFALFRRYAPRGSMFTVRPPIDRMASFISIHACLYGDRSIEAWDDINLIQSTQDVETDFIAGVLAVAMNLKKRKRSGQRWAQGIRYAPPEEARTLSPRF